MPAGRNGAVSGRPAVQHRYAQEARRYDRRWAAYNAATLGPTLSALQPAAGERLLDAGCGTGILLREIGRRAPGVEAVGVDVSGEMLARARQRLGPEVPLLLADVEALPFPAAWFDAVATSSSLHHWPRPASALAEIARVTRPGGRVVVTDWCDDFLPMRLFSRALRLFDASHQRSYRSAELVEMLRAAGFAVERVRRYRFGWQWGLMTASAIRA